MDNIDEERVRVRDTVLDRANEALYDAVQECAKRVPRRDIAAYIRGDEASVHEVVAGRRRAIAEKVRAHAPDGALADVAALLAKPQPGFLPCAFVVTLEGGLVDVSIVALRLGAAN